MNGVYNDWYLHGQIPSLQLGRSHTMQYRCGYKKLGYSWGYCEGTLQLLDENNVRVHSECTLSTLEGTPSCSSYIAIILLDFTVFRLAACGACRKYVRYMPNTLPLALVQDKLHMCNKASYLSAVALSFFLQVTKQGWFHHLHSKIVDEGRGGDLSWTEIYFLDSCSH